MNKNSVFFLIFLTTLGIVAAETKWGVSSGGSPEVFSVFDYGATGDGTTNDKDSRFCNQCGAAMSGEGTIPKFAVPEELRSIPEGAALLPSGSGPFDAVMPPGAAGLAAVFLKETLDGWRWLAIVIGMAGLAVLLSEDVAGLMAEPLGAFSSSSRKSLL